MCPDFDFFLKRLDVFTHTLDSKFRYMINITLPKWFHSSPGWDSGRGGLCSHQGGHVLKLLRHHGSGRQLHQPLRDSWLPLLQWQGGCKEDCQQCGEVEGLPHRRPCGHQQPASLPQRPPDPNQTVEWSSYFSQDYIKLISVRKLIQVIHSIPWVRCASGNVFYIFRKESRYMGTKVPKWGPMWEHWMTRERQKGGRIREIHFSY